MLKRVSFVIVFMVFVLVGCGGKPAKVLYKGTGISSVTYGPDAKSVVIVTSDVLKMSKGAFQAGSSIDLCENSGKKRSYQLAGYAESEWLGNSPALVTSPDHRCLLYRSKVSNAFDQTPSLDLYEIDLTNGNNQKLYHFDQRVRQAIYSPDGKQIALALQSSKTLAFSIGILDRKNNKLSLVYDGAAHGGVVQLMGWQPDGKRLFFTIEKRINTRVCSVPVKGGKEAEICVFGERDRPSGQPVYLNDKELIYCSNTDGLIDLSLPGKQKKVFAELSGLMFPSVSHSGRFIFANIFRNDSHETGMCMVDMKTGQSRSVVYKAKKQTQLALYPIEWHPKKDVILALYVAADGMEVREYDAAYLLSAE